MFASMGSMGAGTTLPYIQTKVWFLYHIQVNIKNKLYTNISWKWLQQFQKKISGVVHFSSLFPSPRFHASKWSTTWHIAVFKKTGLHELFGWRYNNITQFRLKCSTRLASATSRDWCDSSHGTSGFLFFFFSLSSLALTCPCFCSGLSLGFRGR